MKIHTLAQPPAGITFEPLLVETVKVLKKESGMRRVEVLFRTVSQQPVTVTFDFTEDKELPSPEDTVNVSFWRQGP